MSPVRGNFSADSRKIPNHGPAGGREVSFSFFIQFSPAVTPPSAARPSDTGTRLGAGSENRASVAPFPLSPLSRFSASALALNALSRTSRCLPIRRSERQTAG
jgi:hypothetical protein